jgi:hypothetical protein
MVVQRLMYSLAQTAVQKLIEHLLSLRLVQKPMAAQMRVLLLEPKVCRRLSPRHLLLMVVQNQA